MSRRPSSSSTMTNSVLFNPLKCLALFCLFALNLISNVACKNAATVAKVTIDKVNAKISSSDLVTLLNSEGIPFGELEVKIAEIYPPTSNTNTDEYFIGVAKPSTFTFFLPPFKSLDDFVKDINKVTEEDGTIRWATSAEIRGQFDSIKREMTVHSSSIKKVLSTGAGESEGKSVEMVAELFSSFGFNPEWNNLKEDISHAIDDFPIMEHLKDLSVYFAEKNDLRIIEEEALISTNLSPDLLKSKQDVKREFIQKVFAQLSSVPTSDARPLLDLLLIFNKYSVNSENKITTQKQSDISLRFDTKAKEFIEAIPRNRLFFRFPKFTLPEDFDWCLQEMAAVATGATRSDCIGKVLAVLLSRQDFPKVYPNFMTGQYRKVEMAVAAIDAHLNGGRNGLKWTVSDISTLAAAPTNKAKTTTVDPNQNIVTIASLPAISTDTEDRVRIGRYVRWVKECNPAAGITPASKGIEAFALKFCSAATLKEFEKQLKETGLENGKTMEKRRDEADKKRTKWWTIAIVSALGLGAAGGGFYYYYFVRKRLAKKSRISEAKF